MTSMRKYFGLGAGLATVLALLMGANVVNRFVGYVGGTARQYIVADVDASKPVAGVSVGDECYCKDTGYTYKWNGTAWQAPGMARADLQLVLTNTTTITSNPYGGTRAYINGEIVTITGLTCLTSANVITATGTDSGAAAAASTHYYVYRSNSSASYAPGLVRLCATAPSTYLGNLYLAATGNGCNWLYVGDCHTNAATQYEWVNSFYNGAKSLTVAYTVAGTYTRAVPYGATGLAYDVLGGGGPGGSGRRGAAGSLRGGGGGGGGGGRSKGFSFASSLGANIVVTVGLGGVGGVAPTIDDTDGNLGVAGSLSQIVAGSAVIAYAGPGGRGGAGTSAVGGPAGGSGSQAGFVGYAGSIGSDGSAVGGSGISGTIGGPGAGGGGGLPAGNTERTGGGGGYAPWEQGITPAAGGACAGDGIDGTAGTPVGSAGCGGGSKAAAGGGRGGDGGNYSAGGGGGGAGTNGTTGGRGGHGAPGAVLLVWGF